MGVRKTLGTATKPEITRPPSPAAKPPPTVRAAVLGATGYAGRELLTLLVRHPKATVVRLISSHLDGKRPFPIEQAHPALRGRFSVPCVPLDLEGLAGAEVLEAVAASEVDVVFLATPHETSHDIVPRLLDAGLRVIDLSGAFRLKDKEAYPRWYGFEHRAPAALAEAVYGVAGA